VSTARSNSADLLHITRVKLGRRVAASQEPMVAVKLIKRTTLMLALDAQNREVQVSNARSLFNCAISVSNCFLLLYTPTGAASLAASSHPQAARVAP
jgi:hypothetical protein